MPPGRRLACAALVVALASLGLYAQEPATLSTALTDLISDARGLPSEFAADALIRLSGSSRLSPAIQRELLEEAFMRAYAAPADYRRSTTMSLRPESRQTAQQLAYDTGLTRLTLQVRAAQLLAFTDAPRARELFEWIDVALAPAERAAGRCPRRAALQPETGRSDLPRKRRPLDRGRQRARSTRLLLRQPRHRLARSRPAAGG